MKKQRGTNTEAEAARSDYEWGIDRDVVWVRDLDRGGMSVTNNISAILLHVSQHVPVKEYLLMYCDSSGTWDGLTFTGLTADFFPLNERDYGKAISKLREKASLI
ncbi:hypothetical protein [Pontibacter chitinilyticus]|uniref:hypothetical protein n=1 Tax=Pontibacter chitinilyticus TaxID=2674989 RepID=UPI00321B767A